MINGIGISSGGSKSLGLGGLLALHDADIKYLELSTEPGIYEIIDYAEFARIANIAGVTLRSIHLPFQPFSDNDPSATDEKVRVNTVNLQKRIIKRAAAGGFKYAVIHPSGEPIAEEVRPARMAQAKKTLAELAEFAKEYGMTIAVENLPRTCLGRDSADILELLSAHADLRACFDINHLLSESNIDFIKAVGDKIVALHVSDYDGLDERHWLPGEGKNDWQAIYNALNEVGYDGPWVYEVNYRSPSSIKRTKRYLDPVDFSRNAKEIFENKPLTVIGTPKDNLKHWTER